MATKFEWDYFKATANHRKHKVSFQQAREAFKDPFALDEIDNRKDYGEVRFNLIGMVESRLVVATYTQGTDEETGDEIVRIISARRATSREARRYHEA